MLKDGKWKERRGESQGRSLRDRVNDLKSKASWHNKGYEHRQRRLEDEAKFPRSWLRKGTESKAESGGDE